MAHRPTAGDGALAAAAADELRRVAGRRRLRRRRRAPPRTAADEGRRAGLPARRHGDLPGRARWAQSDGAAPWVGYVRAAAEAGMVGALADWFAVTALFKHPLGIPIPHTAIIKRKKDQLGEGLGALRAGELHVAGGRRDQAARRGGRRPARQVAVGAVARRAGRRRSLHRAAGAGGDAARRGRPARAGPDDRQAHRRAAVGTADRPGAGHAAGRAPSGGADPAAGRPRVPVVAERRRDHRAGHRARLARPGRRAGSIISSATGSTAS